jgi:hypothetical protein
MNASQGDDRAALRRSVYAILIFIAAGGMLGRILAVDSVDTHELQENRIRRALDGKERTFRQQGATGEKLDELLAAEEDRLREALQLDRPFLSANDRSRWATVRALVEPEMRVAAAPYAIDRVIAQPRWDTIDMVKHGGHLYSSKPPLFATLLAGEYWLIYHLTGTTLQSEPYAVGRFLLGSVNLLPMLVYLLLLARLAERFGTSDWGRIFVVAAGALGTFLTTFAVVLNNHLPGAVCALVALYAAIRIAFDGRRQWRYFVIVGLFSALLAAEELPALALAGLLLAGLAWRAPRQTLLGCLPAAALVAAAFFATNEIAFGSLKPPYLHRSPGDNWYDYTYERNGRQIESYWNHPVGIDQGEPSKAVYALNALVGHHGIFSLTPMWLLSAAGLAMALRSPRDRALREVAAMIGLVSVVCLAFYLSRPLEHRNYGGMSSGLRWMFWFAPLWLLVMLPAADWAARRRWTRAVALLLLALSVLSVSYPTWNPWTHPWIYNFANYLGWL